jgi:hypothetical protein
VLSRRVSGLDARGFQEEIVAMLVDEIFDLRGLKLGLSDPKMAGTTERNTEVTAELITQPPRPGT